MKAQEMLDVMIKWDTLELAKAVIAYELGVDKIDADANARLNKLIDWYLDADYETSLLNDDIRDKAREGGLGC